MSTPDEQPPADAFDDLVLDESYVSGGPHEASAQERTAKAARIARENDRLRREGEIADGTGKPRYGRLRRSTPWIAIGAVIAVAIVVIAIVAR